MEENSQPSETAMHKSGGMTPMLIVGVIAIVALVGGFFVLSGQTSQEAQPAPGSDTTAVEESDAMMKEDESDAMMEETNETSDAMMGDAMEEGQTIDMEAGAFYYSVKEIRAKKGEKITINMTAKDMMHDFNIDELGVDGEVVKAGESTVVTFTADQVGEFEYYCSVGQHRQNGQIGTIIVTE